MKLRCWMASIFRSVPYVLYRAGGCFNPRPVWEEPPSPEVVEKVRKVLAVRLDAIGDFLMTTPALRALRKRCPAAELHVLVQPGVVSLVRGLGWIDRVESLPCNFLMRGTGWVSGVFRWLYVLGRLRREGYDLVVDFTGLFHSAVAARATAAPLRVGFRRNLTLGYFQTDGFGHFYTHEFPAAESLHIAEEMSLLAGVLGATADGGGWEMKISSEARREAEDVLSQAGVHPEEQPLVVVHAGAKWPPRRWSHECFAETIDEIQSRGGWVFVIGGSMDREVFEKIRWSCRTSPAVLWPPKSLETMGALIERADVFLGNDSGPMHMAAAVGTPIVALFGPTNPARSGPKGSPATILYAGLDCSPCRQYFTRDRCHRGHNYCMDDFRPSAVAAAVELAVDRLKRIPRPSGVPSPRTD